MAKKKENSFSDLVEKFSAKKTIPRYEVKPDVFNRLWNGFHLGSIVSIWGEKGCGKTSLTLQLIRSLCKQGKKGVFIDIEKAFNEFMQQSFGLTEFIENGQLIVVTCSNWLEYEQIIISLDDSDLDIDFMVTDSMTMITAYIPTGQTIEGIRPGIKSLQEAQVLNKMKDIAYRNEIGCVLLYHARANIQINGGNPYAPASKMAGGYVAEHAPDIICKIQAHSKIKGSTADAPPIGVEISVVCEKNKFRAPFEVRKEKLIYGKGIDSKISLIEKAIELGVIKQSGPSFIIPDLPNVRGRQALYDLPIDALKHIKALVEDCEAQD